MLLKISEWLEEAQTRLRDAGIDSSELDSEILLSDVLGKERVFLHAHPEMEIGAELSADEIDKLNKKLIRRIGREPLAYIRGIKEFYGREFKVTTDVLVPRPESEEIIELVLGLDLPANTRAVDVGTGSGVLGITLKLECDSWNVEACDISPEALKVAKENAVKLGANVYFYESNLLEKAVGQYDLVVANLPYVGREWEVSPEVNTEPELAIYADDDGDKLIKELLEQARELISYSGYVAIEADERQHVRLIGFAEEKNYNLAKKSGIILVFQMDGEDKSKD